MMYDELKDKKVVLFGAGAMGKSIYNELTQNGVNVAYFVDSNLNMQDSEGSIDEMPVKCPEFMLSESKSDLKIIITPRNTLVYYEIRSLLLQMGLFLNEYQLHSRNPLEKMGKIMYIDIVDSCNLKCKT